MQPVENRGIISLPGTLEEAKQEFINELMGQFGDLGFKLIEFIEFDQSFTEEKRVLN